MNIYHKVQRQQTQLFHDCSQNFGTVLERGEIGEQFLWICGHSITGDQIVSMLGCEKFKIQ